MAADKDFLDGLDVGRLRELVGIYARNIYALDGVWFQSIERESGMDAAMMHDRKVWSRFTRTESFRLKKFLGLPERAGLDGLERALALRFSALANPEVEICRESCSSLLYRVVVCRVQEARREKGMPYHPCHSVGIIEHRDFARVIDDRIECEAVSCYPEVNDPECACAWRFTLAE